MILFRQKGNFNRIEKFLDNATKIQYQSILEKYGREGVSALSRSTPTDTGKTAQSWYYTVSISRGVYKITWSNSNVSDGVPIAVLIQYGHGTKNGGYVQGRDYINPAIRPIFDKIADEAWREVIKI
jgi:hypothetical protein